MLRYLNLIVILAVAVPITAGADQDVLPATDDAVVVQGYSGTNYGSDDYLTIGYHSSFGWANTLVKFDLSSYTGTTINGANLRLYVYDHVGAFPTDEIYITINDTDWSEGSVTWNNKPGFTTFGPVTAPSSHDWWVIDVGSEVQSILDGTYGDFGFQIYKGDYDEDTFNMRSKEYSSNHPELVIDYPSTVESASLGEIKAVFK